MTEVSESTSVRTREMVAMAKLRDLDASSVFYHQTSIEKLKDILEEGLITESFAKKTHKDAYRREMGSSWNLDSISLTSGKVKSINAVEGVVTIIVEPLVIPGRAKGLRKPQDKVSPFDDEFLLKHRIAPRELKGIEVYALSDIKRVIEIVEGLGVDLALPIYFLENLVWPKKMSHEEIVKMLKERET